MTHTVSKMPKRSALFLRLAMLGSAAALALAGCEQKPTEEDAVAAGFEPPTVMPRADFAVLLDRRFARFDTNANGAIDKSEAVAAGSGMLDTLDTDKDGKISRAEFVAGRLARFDRNDTDHNGIVTNKERDAARAR
ncbi:EF-hand domain-containing protein [Sphingomonas sp. HMP6]|uniref:EF-hand domain-containing protein n=1 Tax=Sphingomonas sp. HMP6 TaxID=1517551 RepID=UPI001596A033|nr:EF-hand domain-containing protein [Sphingomonas sp. HMP6]BCA59786.1 hypothetical protein HMP06_2555 [Sphingomonas sp. HMP6]